jgi:hypothetical protein
MEIQPRLKTIEMVRDAIRRNDGKYSTYQLWKRLPKHTMYQTFKVIIEYLLKNNDVIIMGNKKISRIPKQAYELKHTDRETILYNLSYYGYDLISIKKIAKKPIMPIEELITNIIIRYPEARFIEAIPTLILKNRIDKFELNKKAFQYGLQNKIGFFIELAFKLAERKKKDLSYLKELLNKLKKEKGEEKQYITPPDSADNEFLERNTPAIMKKWNLRGRFALEDFYKEAYL